MRLTALHLLRMIDLFISSFLKDTRHYSIGNCQRPVFSLGVSQHMHTITNLSKFELNYWSSKLRDNNERKKNTLATLSCALSSA